MATTGRLGSPDSQPGNIVLGQGAAGATTTFFAHTAGVLTLTGGTHTLQITSPPSTLGVPLPDLQVVVSVGAAKRILNGIGKSSSNAVAQRVQWSSIIPGGHHTFSCQIVDTERSGNVGIYKYGATVTLRQAPAVGGLAESGQILWQGYLVTPLPNDDRTCDLVGKGWHHLLAERDDALLWQDRYYGDWQPADAEGFALGITSDGLDAQVNNSSLGFSVKKGTDLNDGAHAKLVWYYANPTNSQVLPRRIAFTLHKNIVVPGGGSPNYNFVLTRYLAPNLNGSRGVVNNYDGAISNNNRGDNGTNVIDLINQAPTPYPVIALEFIRNGPTNATAEGFKITVRELRISDLALAETYLASQVVNDLATKTGFTAGSKVETTTQNILPLFWQEGPWWDLVQYLSVAENTKWAVWENNPNPELEFRTWETPGKSWTTNAYGTSARVIAHLAPDDEVYSVVDVAYKKGNSTRVRHVRKPVTPDPFSGMTPPRVRTYRMELQDGQPDDVFAQSIADTLAEELGTEQYAGTVTGSFFTEGSTDKTCYAVRAGDELTIADFPGGSKTVRVYGVDHRDDGPSTLTIGKVPSRLDRILWWADQKKRRKGTRG